MVTPPTEEPERGFWMSKHKVQISEFLLCGIIFKPHRRVHGIWVNQGGGVESDCEI